MKFVSTVWRSCVKIGNKKKLYLSRGPRVSPRIPVTEELNQDCWPVSWVLYISFFKPLTTVRSFNSFPILGNRPPRTLPLTNLPCVCIHAADSFIIIQLWIEIEVVSKSHPIYSIKEEFETKKSRRCSPRYHGGGSQRTGEERLLIIPSVFNKDKVRRQRVWRNGEGDGQLFWTEEIREGSQKAGRKRFKDHSNYLGVSMGRWGQGHWFPYSLGRREIQRRDCFG